MEDSFCREMLLTRAKENNLNISFVSNQDMEEVITKYWQYPVHPHFDVVGESRVKPLNERNAIGGFWHAVIR